MPLATASGQEQAALLDVPPSTYTARAKHFGVQLRQIEVPGGDAGLTGCILESPGKLANAFVRHDNNFKDNILICRRNLRTAPIVNSGTRDLIRQSPPPNEEAPSLLFKNKPELSMRDLIWLMICLEKGGTYVHRDSTGHLKISGDYAPYLSSSFEDILYQVIEQIHINRARYCILAGWDVYVVFHLSDANVVMCSKIVLRDPDQASDLFDPNSLVKRSGYFSQSEDMLKRRLDPFSTLQTIQSLKCGSSVTLMEVVVALLIETSELGVTSNPWKPHADGRDDDRQLWREEENIETVFRDMRIAEQRDRELEDVQFTLSTTCQVTSSELNYPIPPSDPVTWIPEDKLSWSYYIVTEPQTSSIDSMQPMPRTIRVCEIAKDPSIFTTPCVLQKVHLDLTEYISSGRCYDAYRGTATVRYSKGQLIIPIVAKYIDLDAAVGLDCRGPSAADAFWDECNMLDRLQDTNLVPKHFGTWTDDSKQKILMILEDYGQQADLANENVRRDVVAAYNTIHSRHILHGDVQPRHVLLHTDGKIRIIDWEGATACYEGFAEGYDSRTFSEEIQQLRRMLGRVASRLTLTFPDPCDWK